MRETYLHTVRKFVEAMNDRDYKDAIDLIDPEIEWHLMDFGPLAGVHRGHDGVRALFQRLTRRDWESFRLEYDELLEAGNRVLLLGVMRGRGRAGRRTEMHIAWLMTIVRGEILRIVSYRDEDAARRALERHRRASPRPPAAG
jgi:ketosteroid isomerase-like protein